MVPNQRTRSAKRNNLGIGSRNRIDAVPIHTPVLARGVMQRALLTRNTFFFWIYHMEGVRPPLDSIIQRCATRKYHFAKMRTMSAMSVDIDHADDPNVCFFQAQWFVPDFGSAPAYIQTANSCRMINFINTFSSAMSET